MDVWSVGCIFAELLSRKILFQAQSPVQQVEGSQSLSSYLFLFKNFCVELYSLNG